MALVSKRDESPVRKPSSPEKPSKFTAWVMKTLLIGTDRIDMGMGSIYWPSCENGVLHFMEQYSPATFQTQEFELHVVLAYFMIEMMVRHYGSYEFQAMLQPLCNFRFFHWSWPECEKTWNKFKEFVLKLPLEAFRGKMMPGNLGRMDGPKLVETTFWEVLERSVEKSIPWFEFNHKGVATVRYHNPWNDLGVRGVDQYDNKLN